VKRRGSLIDRVIDAVAANVTSFTKTEWARQAKAVVGIDLATIEPNLTPTINSFRRANVELITSMARDKVERVKAILDDAPNARVETIRDRILEEGGVTKRQAALIARDQVLSLNAQVTQKRHAAAGIERYIWRTSGDGDVRPAHRALDGKVFSYDDPPVVDAKKGRREHPGEDYQCRCTAEPVIEGFDEVEEPAAQARTDEFKESMVSRAPSGRFTSGGGGGRGPLRAKEKQHERSAQPTTPSSKKSPKPARTEEEEKAHAERVRDYVAQRAARVADRSKPSRAPDPNAVAGGTPKAHPPADLDPENIRARDRENESIQIMARAGFDTVQDPLRGTPNRREPGKKDPDYHIGGRVFDCVAPSSDRPRNVWDRARDKVEKGQATRVLINLSDSAVDRAALRAQFLDHPIVGLDEVIVIERDGGYTHFDT
jgi:SPP1 gp7 family putative phage head morphogenesis protein